MIFAAKDVNLIHFNPQHVSYEPKGIHTEALEVTLENIGKLALEFEVELYCMESLEQPFFIFTVVRGSEVDPRTPRKVTVRPGDWIVPLRGEIHVYSATTFGYTFSPDQPALFDGDKGQIVAWDELGEEKKEEQYQSYLETQYGSKEPAEVPLSDQALYATGKISSDELDERNFENEELLLNKPSPYPREQHVLDMRDASQQAIDEMNRRF